MTPAHQELLRLMVDLVSTPDETEEHFEARCRAVVKVRRELRAQGMEIPAPDEWEIEVGERMDAAR